MQINKTMLTDCYEIVPRVFTDKRGTFVKTFHHDSFVSNQLETQFTEQYYSFSHQGVLRGLHFQNPPMHHVKLVYCIMGEVLDAVVDLRNGSPTYGQNQLFKLSAEKKNLIYIPAGMAHGFYVTSENAVVVCNLSTVYSPEYDSGIRWDSLGILWPDQTPILSQKDKELPLFTEFSSPFRYEEADGL
ncbi:dTDP-4-dehydrorhamnose 3,5-epimerase [Virgibacillus sp. JSM 102003]|uniref:dTDP-4-dehydrorhamnose 3,5-epimerase n=1 Tax=Virgibacillus sp. JSM 102003 TaxID=1562108 RepID=UPI0035C22F7F